MESIRVRFHGSASFQGTLKRRVEEHFEGLKITGRDAPRMYAKSALILGTALGSYGLLMFAAVTWWQGVILAIALALGMAGIGFSVQHDANHGGYSRNRWINRLMGLSLDMIGASSFIWYWKHNIVHHTYTNVSGVDVDIEMEPLLRLAPNQRWRRYHRFQHFYIWVLYALMPANWHFWADYRDLANGHISGQRFPRPTKRVLAGTLAGKALFYGWSLVLPLCLHPTWAVLGFYMIVTSVLGIVMTTTFQLAHCVDEAEVATIDDGIDTLAVGWAEHQVRIDCKLRAGQWVADLVSRGVELPDRAPPLPQGMPRALPGAFADCISYVRGIRHSLPVASERARGRGFAFPVGAEPGDRLYRGVT